MKTIEWKNVMVEVSKIRATPNNFKIRTEQGMDRFNTSTKNYGLAGAVILNSDYTLIDGNTRVEKAKELGKKKIWASMPDRKLNLKEFTEFAAMYDAARAGDVDTDRIKKELGTTKDFLKTWGLADLPGVMDNLEQLDSKDKKIVPTSKGKEQVKVKNETAPVTLLFTTAENEVFIKAAEKLYGKYKVDNVTDLVFKIFTKKNLL